MWCGSWLLTEEERKKLRERIRERAKEFPMEMCACPGMISLAELLKETKEEKKVP